MNVEASRHLLEPPADLYDGIYSDSLKGRWRSRTLGFVLIVEGRGSRRGTVAAYARHDPGNRQDDLPITTLHKHYEHYESLRGAPPTRIFTLNSQWVA